MFSIPVRSDETRISRTCRSKFSWTFTSVVYAIFSFLSCPTQLSFANLSTHRAFEKGHTLIYINMAHRQQRENSTADAAITPVQIAKVNEMATTIEFMHEDIPFSNRARRPQQGEVLSEHKNPSNRHLCVWLSCRWLQSRLEGTALNFNLKNEERQAR